MMMTEKASGWCLSFFFLWLVLRMSSEDKHSPDILRTSQRKTKTKKNNFWNFYFFSQHSCCSTFSCLSTISDCKNLRHQTDWPSITTVRHDDKWNTKEIIKYKGGHCGNHTKKEKKKTLGNKYCERKWKKICTLQLPIWSHWLVTRGRTWKPLIWSLWK